MLRTLQTAALNGRLRRSARANELKIADLRQQTAVASGIEPMTAGLTAIGVDCGVAVSAVLVYRLASYYLPPLWGYVCLRWLTRHDHL